MTKTRCAIAATIALVYFFSCQNQAANKNKTETGAGSMASSPAQQPLRERVLTAEEQKALTPDTVIERLKEGNTRFVNNNVTARDHSAMVRNAAAAQYPKAVILSCVDSRIPVEDVFDKG